MFKFSTLIFCFWVLPVFTCGAREHKILIKQIDHYLQNGAVLLHTDSGRELLSVNANSPLVPASIIKIFTSQVALDILGEDYRFKTDFYLDTKQNLVIKGWGDPYLISEEIILIAQTLKKHGLKQVRQLLLDSSTFIVSKIPGRSKTLNPYDALNGALVVNFNSLYVEHQKNDAILSAESITPLTPLARQKGVQVKPGNKERINLTDSPIESLQYAGELFKTIFTQEGITINSDQIGRVKVEESWQHIYQHKNSKQLPSVIQGLLKYSNNFIANQIFLTLGAKHFGYPASLIKSQRFLTTYIQQHYPDNNNQFLVVEASGLSRDNRITAQKMMQVLNNFKSSHQLLAFKKGAWYKSGTLTGVYNYAGYLYSKNKLYPFVIMLNQTNNTRDKILDLLKKYIVKISA